MVHGAHLFVLPIDVQAVLVRNGAKLSQYNVA
jgi:hypothetical protein